ncbi:MAG TPA: efflux RND transporter permease subunit, partial [Parasegetibacter sp.]
LPVKISDVADLTIGPTFRIGEGAVEGKPAVIMTITKQSNTNTLELTKRIDDAIDDLRKTLPADVKIKTDIFRQADFIKASVNNVQKVLWEGSLFVTIILFLFLMNWRATSISLIAIPISLLSAVLILKWFGFTINTMSLGGMAIAIGDLVDDAIIDVENVFRRLKENAARPPELRTNKLKVIFDASVEIRTSVINATFIIIVAFTPLFFLSGMEGRLLVPLGIAFIVALFASLIVAITLTPVLCSYLLTGDKMLQKQHKESWLVHLLNIVYERLLQLVFRLKKSLLTVSAILIVAAVVLLTRMGRSFLPEFNEGSLVVTVTSLPGISLEESGRIGAQVEKVLLSIPEVRTTSRRTGRAELDEHTQGVNSSEVDAPFELKVRSREEFMKEVREKLSSISGANFSIGQPISHRIDHMLSGTRANIAVKVYGNDLEKLFRIANNIKQHIKGIDGLVDVNVEQQAQVPQIQIKPNREMLSRFGITIGQFAEFVNVALAGEKVSEIFEGGERYDLIVKFDSTGRGSVNNIRNTLIDAYNGEKIPLSYVADVVSLSGPNTISRENVQRKTVVSANVSGRDQKSAVDEIKKIVDEQIELPEGYRIEYGGQFESEAAASRTLFLTSIMAFIVIFFLLYQEFKSIRIAGVILINLPLALIGGVLTVWFTSGILSIPVIIGFITLFGIATRNGILLVSHYHTLQKEGMSLYESVIKGSVDRLSPILMTALTAGLALIPLAVSGDLPGNEIQSPMAKVILGGLLSSTLLNLFVVPVVYFISNKKSSANEK